MGHSSMSRRLFLRGLSLQGGAMGLGVAGCRKKAQANAVDPIDPSTIAMKYRLLGRTGLRISEVGFGGFPVDNPSVLDHAIEVGINYVDTAPDYRDGRSETVIGKVLERRRKDLVVATKWHPGPKTRREEMLKSLEASLKRLRTDYVDLVQVHSVRDVRRLQNPELLEAFRIAKKKGMARFLGATSHSPTLMSVMDWAIESGHFDVLLCKYNFLDFPKEPALFRKAKERNVGVLAMKTLSGAKHANLAAFRGKEDDFGRAALKWVLSNRDISGLVISMSTFDQVRGYAAASGRKFAARDHELLERYAKLAGREVCRGCEECHDACPSGVPVADVLRFAMYDEDYGQKQQAQRLYKGLLPEQSAAACLGCHAPCESACSDGLRLSTKMPAAHRSLAV